MRKDTGVAVGRDVGNKTGVAVGNGVGNATGDGSEIGVAVGGGVGNRTGVAVGNGLGIEIGVAVGAGVAVGRGVGNTIAGGVEVGSGLGRKGVAVGRCVGNTIGVAVGAGVAVGSGVGNTTSEHATTITDNKDAVNSNNNILGFMNSCLLLDRINERREGPRHAVRASMSILNRNLETATGDVSLSSVFDAYATAVEVGVATQATKPAKSHRQSVPITYTYVQSVRLVYWRILQLWHPTPAEPTPSSL